MMDPWPRPRLALWSVRHEEAVRAEVPGRLRALVDVAAPGSGPVDGVLEPGVWDGAGARHHFLTQVFQLARLRTLPRTSRALMEFHASSKLLLLAHSEPALRRLGPLAAMAGSQGVSLDDAFDRYARAFDRAMARPATSGGMVNALEHAIGHFSGILTAWERHQFTGLLAAYRSGREGAEGPLALLRLWAARHDRVWVACQSLLHPYPDLLRDAPGEAAA
jgi:uncharacterized protein YbgA (DUF1722 family)